ncbi:MAG: protein-L-isoaspartate(D-aspartate) O-methyltransferase [Ignavibacteriales bacterium]|nr:protein-L-isoaspartate(D-aspartate) O-methyltransferase [Ignavibacteriales bacterium]
MYEDERKELVKILYKKGIKDEEVLKAIFTVERHKFVSPGLIHLAYKDSALPIGKGQTISQPYTVAFMTEKACLRKGQKVLEIGTGSGYQAAILTAMGVKVYTIERNHDLYRDVQKIFNELKIRVHSRCGDGTIGLNEFAPYDAILVTASGPKVPESLKKQIAVGGRMIIPVGSRTEQALHVISRNSETDFTDEIVPDFLFVPLIGRNGWEN